MPKRIVLRSCLWVLAATVFAMASAGAQGGAGAAPARPLEIDPALLWNTFLGGSGISVGRGIAVDGSGSVYVAGTSEAPWGSPVRAYAADTDAFVARLDATGALVWNTFLGGPGADYGQAIAVDGRGYVYVAGTSAPGQAIAANGSGNLAVVDTRPAMWGTSPVRAYTVGRDAFVAKLDAAKGTLVWNTFLGGLGSDEGLGIAVDGGGNVYVVGTSNATWGSGPVRAYAVGKDAFAAKLNATNGALVWNTFLGGSGSDEGFGIAVDGGGNVYVAGTSDAPWGSPARAHTAGNDAFAAKLNAASGVLVWNTFLGRSGKYSAAGIAVDRGGDVYVTGTSNATWGSPVRAYTAGDDAFAARVDATSGALVWNTFLGGPARTDQGRGIAVDGGGNVYVAGSSDASWGSPVREYSAYDDAFAATRSATSGALAWNTFLGGPGNDFASGIAVDGGGNVYATGLSNATWGASPVRAYKGSGHFKEGGDAFAAKLAATSGARGGEHIPAAAVAEDFAIKLSHPAKVGDRTLLTGSRRIDFEMIGTASGQETRQEKHSIYRFAVTQKVLAAGAKGNGLQTELAVQKLTREEDGATTELLKGGDLISVRLKGREEVWELGGSPLTAELKEALSDIAGGNAGDEPSDDEGFDTARRRRVGDSWRVDPKLVAGQLARMGIAVAAEDVTGTAALGGTKSVHGILCLEMRFSLELHNVKAPAAEDLPAGVVMAPLTVRASGARVVPVDGARQPLEESFEFQMPLAAEGTVEGVSITARGELRQASNIQVSPVP